MGYGPRCATLNTYVQPACLPQSKTQFQPGHKCYAIGWGTESGVGSKYLGSYQYF